MRITLTADISALPAFHGEAGKENIVDVFVNGLLGGVQARRMDLITSNQDKKSPIYIATMNVLDAEEKLVRQLINSIIIENDSPK